jgi:hypothetical protein
MGFHYHPNQNVRLARNLPSDGNESGSQLLTAIKKRANPRDVERLDADLPAEIRHFPFTSSHAVFVTVVPWAISCYYDSFDCIVIQKLRPIRALSELTVRFGSNDSGTPIRARRFQSRVQPAAAVGLQSAWGGGDHSPWVAPLCSDNPPQPGGKGFAGNPGATPPQEYSHDSPLHPRRLRTNTADCGGTQPGVGVK